MQDPADVFRAAMSRASAERSATEVFRRELDRSESLAVLAPRLAHVESVLAARPPDRTIDLQRLGGQRARFEQHAPRLGPLTARGREYRRGLERFDERRRTLDTDQAVYDEWMAEHADTFRYRDELAANVAARRDELGYRALAEQPAHLVKLLGRVPDDPQQAELWRTHASRIEAYREQWNVPAEHVHESPLDRVQHQEWAHTVRLVRDLHDFAERAANRSLERTLGHGIEIGW
jgi:hypothetical protein